MKNKVIERLRRNKCFMKSSFPDERAAKIALKKLQRSKATAQRFKKGGVYKCEFCESWHLTSKHKKKPFIKREKTALEVEADYWKQKLK